MGTKIHTSAAARLLEAALKATEYGTEYTFDELNKIAERDIKTDRYIIATVARVLRRHHERVIQSVRGKGYRIVHPSEASAVSLSYQQSAKKKITAAFEIIETVTPKQISDMSQEDQLRFLKEQARSGTLLAVCRAIDSRKFLASAQAKTSRIPSSQEVLKMVT